MAKQVSGSDKTLLQAIADGEVPKPGCLVWNDWQQWRSTEGRRPTMAQDGFTCSNVQESALWKAVMLELYGADWAIQAATGEAPVSGTDGGSTVPQARGE